MSHLWERLGELTLAQLANVQTVGIGMYLALAIVQAVSATGVSSLRRRWNTLDGAIKKAKHVQQYAALKGIEQDIASLEISFHAINKFAIWLVGILFTASVSYFIYCTIWQNDVAPRYVVVIIILFYTVLPIIVFLSLSFLISMRCRDVLSGIKRVEKAYFAKKLG